MGFGAIEKPYNINKIMIIILELNSKVQTCGSIRDQSYPITMTGVLISLCQILYTLDYTACEIDYMGSESVSLVTIYCIY